MAAYFLPSSRRFASAMADSKVFSLFCHASRRLPYSLAWAASRCSYASAIALAVAVRTAAENHTCGLSPSCLPPLSAAFTTCAFVDAAAFVAQLSYPAPLTMMTSALEKAAMSALVGS